MLFSSYYGCVRVFDYYLYHKNILVNINLNIDYVYLQFYVPVILPEKIYFVSIFYIEKNICCKKIYC